MYITNKNQATDGLSNGHSGKGKGRRRLSTTRHTAADNDDEDHFSDSEQNGPGVGVPRGSGTADEVQGGRSSPLGASRREDEEEILLSVTATSAERRAFSLEDLRALFNCRAQEDGDRLDEE